jgi:hypothetical protein
MEYEMSVQQQIFGTSQEKSWLKGVLRDGNVCVTFTKKDGTERKMICTLSESAIPQEFAPKGSTKAQSDESLAVFDVESNGWRSFRYDSITKIQVELTGK